MGVAWLDSPLSVRVHTYMYEHVVIARRETGLAILD